MTMLRPGTTPQQRQVPLETGRPSERRIDRPDAYVSLCCNGKATGQTSGTRTRLAALSSPSRSNRMPPCGWPLKKTRSPKSFGLDLVLQPYPTIG